MRHASMALAALLAAAVAAAAPPDVPKALTAKPGQLIRVTVKTDAEIGVLRNFTDEQAFFEELSARKGERRFVFQAPDDSKPGTVFVVGWWTKDETEGAATTITVAGKSTPIVDPVKPDPVKPDPVNPAAVYYFAVVGPSGPVAPATAAVMKLPAWDELRKAGHTVNYIPLNQLRDDLPKPTALPAVMVLKKDGDKWTDTGSNKPLPTTDEAIRGLLK